MESCTSRKEASANPNQNLCCMRLHERSLPHFIYICVCVTYQISRDSLQKYISTQVQKRKQHPALMSFTAVFLMRTRESFLIAGTTNPDCSEIALTWEGGVGIQKLRPRPVWPAYCLLSRLALDHGALQLPGALQMEESSKHDNKGKLGRWIPRESRTGASTEHVQTLRS